MFRFLHATGCWCVLCVAAFANGAVREVWLAPFMGNAAAHVASTLALCCMAGLVAHAHARRLMRETRPRHDRGTAGNPAREAAGDASGSGWDATIGNAPRDTHEEATRTATAMWATGLYWMAATVAFEFLFGRYVAGNAWERLLADYDLTAGRVWVLVPLTLLLGPRIALWRLRRKGGA